MLIKVVVIMNSKELVSLFFKDLKQYNSNNFRIIANADLSQNSPIVYKSCSSVVTRYFIFQERHPEISEADMKILYFKLRIDMIARYFSEYPVANSEDLKPFQRELMLFIEDEKKSKQLLASEAV